MKINNRYCNNIYYLLSYRKLSNSAGNKTENNDNDSSLAEIIQNKSEPDHKGEVIMEQGVLSYQYEREKSGLGMTALGGLPVYLDLAQSLPRTRSGVIGLGQSIGEHRGVREVGQGWRDDQSLPRT